MGTGCLICLGEPRVKNPDENWVDFVVELVKLIVDNDPSFEERLSSTKSYQFCVKCFRLFEELKHLQWQVNELDGQINGKVGDDDPLIPKSKKKVGERRAQKETNHPDDEIQWEVMLDEGPRPEGNGE